MTRTSIKKLWSSRPGPTAAAAALVMLSLPSFLGQLGGEAFAAQFKPKYSYLGRFETELAGHLRQPRDLASQRLSVNFEQKADFSSQLKSVFGFSAWNESVYDALPGRYPATTAQSDSRDLRLRDVYLQYQSENFFLRAGNQQVVWGEAFGFFYSDIVNPKDLRYGLFGDFRDIRLQVPMLNSKLIFSDFSIQAVFIPKPYFNLIPAPGNDFAYPYASLLPVGNVVINRETSAPFMSGNEEGGGRVSTILGSWDLSAFYFNYVDRNPYYAVSATSQLPQTLVLNEKHARVQSYGITATNDFGGFLGRFEGLVTRNRLSPIVVNGNLSQAKVDDYVYVVGMDLPTQEKFNIGFQWSQDIVTNTQGLLRNRVQSLASLRVQRPFFRDHTAEFLYTYSVSDAGQRAQLDYLVPLSGTLESRLGLDVLGGPFSSDFGKINQATRAYVTLRYYLKG